MLIEMYLESGVNNNPQIKSEKSMRASVTGINSYLDGDGVITVSDITMLIELYLNQTSEEYNNKENEHEYVNLGLSVKWATMNIGANTPEEYGNYFAWGEVAAKNIYNWDTYKYCNGLYNTLTKYKNSSSEGIFSIDSEDDAAHVNWNGTWRMPTYNELAELKERCTWTWTIKNGTYGYKVTGPNGNSIFLPATGFCNEGAHFFEGERGDYWSSAISKYNPNYAQYVFFKSDGADWSSDYRCYGRSIRAVCP